MKTKRGRAYNHYLETGEVISMWGFVQDTGGRPADPMTEDQFNAYCRSIPKPTRVRLAQNISEQVEAYMCQPYMSHGEVSYDAGKWAGRFLTVPLVAQAEREGWGRILRGHVRALLLRDAAIGRQFPSPDDCMPSDPDWVEYAQAQARREIAARAYREEIVPSKFPGGKWTVAKPQPPRGGLLSRTSRRMSGDRDHG